LRLIREMHERLLRSGRGGTKNPGEFRRSQNWLGGTRPGNAMFVPPPVGKLEACLHSFEQFMHEDASRMHPLIKAGLLHVQFETIHPFLDGNGRIGRLLVTLFLCVQGVLQKPLLYLSLYLKTHRADYYRLLQEVRERGAWEAWLEFFLQGVAETANQAFDAASQIVDLFKQDRERINEQSERAGSSLRVHDMLQQNPFATANALVAKTGLSAPTVNAALADLQQMGIVEEVTGRRRGRVFSYQAYLNILSEGTAPLPPGG
jgi:Fic family protein